MLKIRKAVKGDIKQIFEIMKSNNPKYPLKQVKNEIKEMFSKSLIKPTYFVVEEKGKLIGCGGFSRSWADYTIFNLFWINISKEHQGKGIGTKLIKEIIKTIKNIKEKPSAKMITLSTNNQKFYKRFGFKKLGKEYDKDYVLMGKRLN